MRKILLTLIVIFGFTQVHAQFVHKIKADSVLITNDSCTAELNLENSTRHVKGFLYNKGNGRTEFRKVVKLNDSTFVFGEDTLLIGGSVGSLTASNGITRSGNNFKLGGPLTEPVAITNTNDPNNITITGTSPINGAILNVIETDAFVAHTAIKGVSSGSNAAIRGENTGTSNFGFGVIGTSTNAIGVQGSTGSTSSGGVGVYGISNSPSSPAVRARAHTHNIFGATNFKQTALEIFRSGSSGGNGMGSKLVYTFPRYTTSGAGLGVNDTTAGIDVTMLNIFGTGRTSKMELYAMGDSTLRNILTLHGDGNAVLNDYTGTKWQVNSADTWKPMVINPSNGELRYWDNYIEDITGVGSTNNFFNTNMSATGNRTHNFKNFDLTIDSIKTLTIQSRGINPTHGLRENSLIYAKSGGLEPNIFWGYKMRNFANTTDSLLISVFNLNSTLFIEGKDAGANRSAGIMVDPNRLDGAFNTKPIVSLGTGNGSTATSVILTDSLYITAKPAASADSVYAPGPWHPGSRTNPVLKVSSGDLSSKGFISDELTSTANADIDLTGLEAAGYKRIEIQFEAQVATDNRVLFMRFSPDGTNFDDGSTDYEWGNNVKITGNGNGSQSITSSPTGGASSMRLTSGLGNNAAYTSRGKITIYEPFESTYRPTYHGQLMSNATSGLVIFNDVFGQRQGAQKTLAVRFYLDSGNFSRFNYRVYAYKN